MSIEKSCLNITFADTTYHRVSNVVSISKQFILGLNFLKENNFKLDFNNNELHSSSEDLGVLK